MKIKKASEAKANTSVWGCIYGQPGVGKTTAALSMPNTLLIDCERGIGRVSGALRTDFVELNSIDEFNLNDVAGYDTLVFDTLGVLLEMFDQKVKETNPKLVKADGALTLQGYGARKLLFKQFIAELRKSGKNVIFLAHVQENKDGDVTKIRPYATGSSVNDLENDLDFMGYMEMRGGKRSISFTPNDAFYAKNSLGLPQYIEVPEAHGGNSFLTDLIVKGNQARIEREEQEGKKYVDVIAKATAIIEDKKLDMNQKTEAIKALDHIFDSKLRCWKALEIVGESAGQVFNKETGKWEPLKK